MSEKAYESASPFWTRTEKNIQSDFICRPHVIPLLGNVTNRIVADLGCGEGYVSRMLAAHGAAVVGVDSSADMIESAQTSENAQPLGIEYHIGDVCALPKEFTNESFDAAISIAVTPHLSHVEVENMVLEAYRILKNRGNFILALPHPKQFVDKPQTDWIHFEYDAYVYERDKRVPVTLFTGDGSAFPIPAAYPHSENVLENILSAQDFTVVDKVTPLATPEDLKQFPHVWGNEDTYHSHLLYHCRKEKIINQSYPIKNHTLV